MAFVLLGLFGVMMLSRWLNERALKPLDANEKARLIDAFSGQRKYSMLVPIGAVLLTLTARPPLTLIFGALVAWVIGLTVYNLRKLRVLGIAESYVRAWLTGQTLQVVALLGFIGAILLIGE